MSTDLRGIGVRLVTALGTKNRRPGPVIGKKPMDIALWKYASRRSPVFARNIVATSEPRAAAAGIEAISRGGNAVDAAIAAAITLTVTEPTGNGIGSDAFAIVWDGGRLHGLNASGRAPQGWREGMFGAQGVPYRGWNSVTVPGAVSAWVALSERFGKLPFERLFERAVDYAAGGYNVSPIIAAVWAASAEDLRPQPGYAEHFLPNGAPPRAGDLFRNPAQAATLRAIAETRGEAFYRGALAEKMARHAAAHGGHMTTEDFARHEPEWCGTIAQAYGGRVLHEIPPNGQGIAALIALGILSHFDLGADPDGVDALHLEIEAMKLALADVAAHVGEPETMRYRAADLLDPAYLASRAGLIDPARAQAFTTGKPKSGGTVYLATADASGMMVSYIQSNYAGFGSGVVVPGTGISLQNRGAGFVAEPGHVNAPGPRKRPFHTIIPGFLMQDEAPLMALGVMGGFIQAQGHMQMVVRTEHFGQDPQTAIDAPRFRVIEGLTVAIERHLDAGVLQGLADRGHEITFDPPGGGSFGFGGAQAIRRIDGGYMAGSDPRKDGHAAAL